VSFAEILLTLLQGAGYTLLVTLACAATALVVGLGIAIARELGGVWLSTLLSAVVYVLRGVPMLVLLFIIFFGLPGVGLDVPPLLAMMLSLGLISGAYLSEVFRGSLAAINPNEVLAAQSMGFSRLATLRLSADQISSKPASSSCLSAGMSCGMTQWSKGCSRRTNQWSRDGKGGKAASIM